jgi:F-type H+-transporting ATPase subunit gamma
MAGNLIALRRRIKAVKNTQKTFRAMKTVSAAKMRRSVTELNKVKPVMEKIESLIRRVASAVDTESHPLLMEREKGKTVLVVISADRGLCGAFNSHLIAKAEAHYRKNLNKAGDNISLVVMGNKAANFFKRRNFPVKKEYRNVMSRLKHQHALDLSKYLQDIYLDPEENIRKVEFIYTGYISAARQELTVRQLFPIKSDWEHEIPVEGDEEEEIEYIFEPSEEEIFKYLLPRYIHTLVQQILFQSAASEHGARMKAMELASQNADEMIRSLTLKMNKLRQASITNELLEIITATEALAK